MPCWASGFADEVTPGLKQEVRLFMAEIEDEDVSVVTPLSVGRHAEHSWTGLHIMYVLK
jgi:hypothetical protein